MRGAVRLVDFDDVTADELRSNRPTTRSVAAGFPRPEDKEALRARDRGAPSFLILEGDVVVGTCGAHGPPDADGRLELGWGLVEDARGRGIGTTAVTLLLDEVRRVHPDVELLAHTEWHDNDDLLVADSPASEAILRRLGFTADPQPTAPGDRRWCRAGP